MGATKLLTAAGGGITLDAASTATDKTITIPARTGNMAVDGPAFAAYMSASTQTLSASTNTKLVLNTEVFDTNSCFDKDTNYRFQPTVAGYYQVNLIVVLNTSVTAQWSSATIYKNGASAAIGGGQTSTVAYVYLAVPAIVYMNGSTDYLEFYATLQLGGTLIGGVNQTAVSATLVRAA